MKNKIYLFSSLMYLFIATSMILNHYGNTSLLDVTHILLWCITLSAIFIFSMVLLVLVLTDSKVKYDKLSGIVELSNNFNRRSRFEMIFTTLLELSVFVLYEWKYLILVYIIQEMLLLIIPNKLKEVINKYSDKE